MLKLLIAGLIVVVAGCSSLVPKPDANVQYLVEKVVAPAVQKAVAETNTRTATLQGGLQGINPKYVVRFDGKWVVGIEGEVEMGLEGVSGQITGHTQGDSEALPKPATRPGE